jgi:hypothetical protein
MALNILTNLRIFGKHKLRGINPLPIEDREEKFRDAHFVACTAIENLIFLIEDYEIANPTLEIFRTAFACATHDMNETYFQYQKALLVFLPYDVPENEQKKVGTDVLIPKIPSEKDLQDMSVKADSYFSAVMNAQSYLSDLAREVRNIFLGNLFEHRFPPRIPLDPRKKAISTAPEAVESLKKYFEEETAWGKDNKEGKDRIKEEISNELKIL